MFLKKLFVHPKSLLLIFVVTALIVVSSALIELNQSKNEMLDLMESQGHTLLESLLTSSKSALISYNKIEDEVKIRLLNNAVMIRTMYENGLVTNSLLKKLAEQNNIYRINIFNKDGRKIFSSHKEIHPLSYSSEALEYLEPIFDDEVDTLIIGIKPARLEDGKRFAVAVSTPKRGAIVLNIDADELLDFRKLVGFGILLKNVTENNNIEYCVLQNHEGIIAASGKIDFIDDIDSSSVLQNILKSNEYHWRIFQSGDHKIFEGLHPFVYSGNVVGIFRLGLSMEPLQKINSRITQRIIFIAIILFVFGFVTLTLIFTRQNFDVLSKRFKAFESYSKQIIENVNDGIIVLDSKLQLKTINNAAYRIFGIQPDSGDGLENILDGDNCSKILDSNSSLQQIECEINGRLRHFLVSKSIFKQEDEESNTVLIFSDLTEQIQLEKQIQRNDRLAAMGELASSVAHEIRNPLNAIGTITQQLNKDFIPTENAEEYKSLSQLVYKEVKRINETIENFLRFAKPLPLKPQRFNTSVFLQQIEKQYRALLTGKNIQLNITENWSGEVEWDMHQIQQVIINLLENSIDAVTENGNINIFISEIENGSVEIKFSDSGKGIDKEIINKIFNLYFTTKATGSGIGLSIVQKIINEHKGIISAANKPGSGAEFIIVMPKQINQPGTK